MVGTRQWISEVQVPTTTRAQTPSSNGLYSVYFEKLLIQGKKISQIISYIWLNQDPQTAQVLDGYFKRGDDEQLKKLLFAEEHETDEYKLLLKVFKDKHYLPIFDPADKGFLKFRIAIDKFEGNISDPGPGDNGLLTVTIPYPPRPEVSDDTMAPQEGYAPIKTSELKEWLDQAPDEKPYFYENNPYIPTTTS